jgi:hypothetical protein
MNRENQIGGWPTPRRVKLGEKPMFRIEDVEQWVKSRIEEPSQLRQRIRVIPPLKACKRLPD